MSLNTKVRYGTDFLKTVNAYPECKQWHPRISCNSFKALIPEGVRIVVTITANNGNGSGRASGWFGYYRQW